MLDVDRLAEAMLEGARALIAKELAPLREANEALRRENAELAERIKSVEDRPIEAPGVTFDPAEIKAIVDEAMTGLEVKEPGDLQDRIRAAVDEAVKAIPPARDGKDADPAEMQGLKETVAELRGWKDAVRIPEAIHGKDGRSIVGARVNDDGELVLKYSDGDTANLGRIRGQDGKDAFEIDALSLDYDGERSFSIGWPDGRKAAFDLPVPIYRGVWKDGSYKRGDQVTWGGSVFTAMVDTESKPETDKTWLLSNKRGRDGREVVKTAPKSDPVKLEGGHAD